MGTYRASCCSSKTHKEALSTFVAFSACLLPQVSWSVHGQLVTARIQIHQCSRNLCTEGSRPFGLHLLLHGLNGPFALHRSSTTPHHKLHAGVYFIRYSTWVHCVGQLPTPKKTTQETVTLLGFHPPRPLSETGNGVRADDLGFGKSHSKAECRRRHFPHQTKKLPSRYQCIGNGAKSTEVRRIAREAHRNVYYAS